MTVAAARTSIASLLQARAASAERLSSLLFGLNWTVAECESGSGLCYSPSGVPRNIDWPGSLAGRRIDELLPWLDSPREIEVAAAVAAANAVINRADNPLLRDARPLSFEAAPHLAVFRHFAPRLAGANVVVVGRYPGIGEHLPDFSFQCVERRPGPGDLPEAAAPAALAAADWVFVTASSIANRSLPDLLYWSRNARTVLMGPSMPWLEEWAEFGVDYLAGVAVGDADQLWQVAAEAGGTRIFQGSVQYHLRRLG